MDHFIDNQSRRLSGNTLKIIAALTMLIDHIGIVFFPNVEILRIIGRIAFPIYAFMISEGCAYTKNKLRYFLSVFVLGAACQTVYFIYDGDTYMSILITFSISIIVIYTMQYMKETLFSANSRFYQKGAAILLFLLAVGAVYVLNIYVKIDYGFWGCMVPVFASVFRNNRKNPSASLEKLDNLTVHVIMLGIALIIRSSVTEVIQFYSLLSIPLLMLYSGKRGKYKMKYFFYIFYPAHLVALECISYLFN